MNSITEALTTEKPINLNVVGRGRDDILTSAHILGVNNQANGEVVAAHSK